MSKDNTDTSASRRARRMAARSDTAKRRRTSDNAVVPAQPALPVAPARNRSDA